MIWVKAKGLEGYKVQNTSSSHSWLGDEPVAKGGSDAGPSPSELMLSALASCKIITCTMYAQRKEWKLEGIEIELRIPDNEPRVIEKKIHFLGDLDSAQRERLLAISSRCPVAKFLDPAILFRLID